MPSDPYENLDSIIRGEFQWAEIKTQEINTGDDHLAAHLEFQMILNQVHIEGSCEVKQVVGAHYEDGRILELLSVETGIPEEFTTNREGLRAACEAYLRVLVGGKGSVNVNKTSPLMLTEGLFQERFPFEYPA